MWYSKEPKLAKRRVEVKLIVRLLHNLEVRQNYKDGKEICCINEASSQYRDRLGLDNSTYHDLDPADH